MMPSPSPLSSSSSSGIALHVYVDFDSTMTLQDTGNTLLIHEIGQAELLRLNRLPETSPPGEISLRKAEDMKWERIKLSVQEAADILINPQDDVLAWTRDGEEEEGESGGGGGGNGNGNGDGETTTTATTNSSKSSSSNTTTVAVAAAAAIGHGQGQGQGQGQEMAANLSRRDSTTGTNRIPFEKRHGDGSASERSYFVQLDPGFKEFHQYCRKQGIPITIVSVGIKPLIEEMLNRYLGYDHGIEVRANELRNEDGWKLIRRDTSPYGVEKGRELREARANDLQNPLSDQILWCGDAKTDFPAALRANIVLARQNTVLERLLKANSIAHQVFTTFATVKEAVEAWVLDHSKEVHSKETTTTCAAGEQGGGVVGGGGTGTGTGTETGTETGATGRGRDAHSDCDGHSTSSSSSSSSFTPSSSESRSVVDANDS